MSTYAMAGGPGPVTPMPGFAEEWQRAVAARLVYVHATVKGFHPRNRYRVVDAHTVAERGWSSASGMWGLGEADRQVCPTPDESACACVVVQRDRT